MQFDLNRAWTRLQFSSGERLRLYRKIAKMLANGLPLLKIIEELGKRASENGRKPNEPLAIILDDCRRMVQNGRMLAEGLEPWIPRSEQMILMAGEQSGRLEMTLIAVIGVVAASTKIRNVVIAGIAYPAAILALIFMYMYLFGTRVIPEFARIVDPSTWRGAARSLHVMSGIVQNWMFLVVALLVCVFVAVAASMPRWRGNARVFLDRFPPYSIYRLIAGSSFLMSFAALQAAGVTVEKSLLRLAGGAQPWLQERLEGALLGVKSGLNCGEALRNSGYGFPSREIIDDLCVYSEYKGFSEALKALADEWMEEGVEKVSAYVKVANGMAIILLAIVIGWLVTGFFGIQQEIASMARAVR